MCLEVFGIVSLQAFHYGNAHPFCQVRIFSIGFHATSPTGITEDIDIRGPEGQAFVAVVFFILLILMVFGTGFVAYHRECLIQCVVIKSSRHRDCLWENGRFSGTCDTVQGFVPPIVLGNSETFDCRSRIHHLSDLLFRSQTLQEVVYTFVDREIGVAERIIFLSLTTRNRQQ